MLNVVSNALSSLGKKDLNEQLAPEANNLTTSPIELEEGRLPPKLEFLFFGTLGRYTYVC